MLLSNSPLNWKALKLQFAMATVETDEKNTKHSNLMAPSDYGKLGNARKINPKFYSDQCNYVRYTNFLISRQWEHKARQGMHVVLGLPFEVEELIVFHYGIPNKTWKTATRVFRDCMLHVVKLWQVLCWDTQQDRKRKAVLHGIFLCETTHANHHTNNFLSASIMHKKLLSEPSCNIHLSRIFILIENYDYIKLHNCMEKGVILDVRYPT